MLDKIKLLVAVLLVAAGIAGFYYFADTVESVLYRVLALLAVFIVAFVVALQTQVGSNTWNFGRSAILEVRKAVWPTRQETVQATLMVMVMVIIMGVLLWLFDMVLLEIVQMLTGQGG
jgi:preprotein translocase subunit SecE